MNTYYLIIIMGLPGSGKTTLAEQLKGKEEMHVVLDNLEHQLLDYWISQTRWEKRAIYDGLFLVTDDVITILEKTKELRYNEELENVQIIYFNEDREACKWNDIGRREIPSKTSIDHLKTEVPDLELLKERFPGVNFTLERRDVTRKDAWKVYFAKKDVYEEKGKLVSPKWSNGGYAGNCWGEPKEIDVEDQPDFVSLDKLLETIVPGLSYLQYKKIDRECVDIKEWRENDYYGCHMWYKRYECDLEKLYGLLNEMELIEEVA